MGLFCESFTPEDLQDIEQVNYTVDLAKNWVAILLYKVSGDGVLAKERFIGVVTSKGWLVEDVRRICFLLSKTICKCAAPPY
jgi:hypothetical protein